MIKSRIKSCSFFIVCCCAMLGCEEERDDVFLRHFIIRKGKHYASPRVIEMLQSERLTIYATFDKSAIYDLHDLALQTNKNKLIGFSDCNSRHHENSARFAWQWFNNSLEIYAYCYVDDVRVEQFLGVVQLNESNRYDIDLTSTEYIFYLNGERKTGIARSQHVCNVGAYYLLYPYFGGSVAAPHDIRIDISMGY